MIPNWTRFGARIAALALGAAGPLLASDFYVAPAGSPSGNGSIGSPWDLQTALNQPSTVHAGDTIWLRGGTYTGHFTNNLNGSSSSPIIVRQYAGERATIDGYDGTSSTDPAITVDGSYTWFWGFEVTNSSPNRTTNNGGNTPPPGRGPGFYLGAPGVKLINLVVHDTSQGLDVWEAATDAEVTGNIVYYNGWDDLGTRGSGHGIYTQNLTSTKHFYDNILFEGFSYGIHAYAEGGHLDNLQFQGNTSFDNGGLSHVSPYAANLLVGGTENMAQNPALLDNYTYFPSGGKYSNLGYEAGCSNANVTGNYFAGGQSFRLVNCTNVSHDGERLLRHVFRIHVLPVPGQHLLFVGSDRNPGLPAAERLRTRARQHHRLQLGPRGDRQRRRFVPDRHRELLRPSTTRRITSARQSSPEPTTGIPSDFR